MQDGDGAAPSIFLAQQDQKLQKLLSWYGQLDRTLSDDLTQGIQGIVGKVSDVCESVLVETNRCFGRERETSLLRVSTDRKPRLLAHSRASATCFPRNARIPSISLLKPTASSFHHSRFHSWAYSSATHCGVCREISLPVSNDQRELRECVLFPTPPVSWTCSFFQCLAQPFVRCTSAAFQSLFEAPARPDASRVLTALGMEY